MMKEEQELGCSCATKILCNVFNNENDIMAVINSCRVFFSKIIFFAHSSR